MLAPAEDVIRRAARLIDQGVRLDMNELAAEFGVSRATLFRRVGNREELTGEALWWLAERTLAAASARWERSDGPAVRSADGKLRTLRIMDEYAAAIVSHAGFQRLLDEEPVTTLRILTDPFGKVQPRMITAYLRMLERDVADGGFTPLVDLDTLSYGAVRLGEAVIYADIVAAREPDLAAASALVDALVEGVLRPRS
ncbi:QsdR family transcriptional regulator [Streptomyces sp. NPDC053755]|uniref:QsdR family transcriptional regulator n=1 Tax=Streptomyces sp. NPDC053755 TaxID=3155815 RepID=UPI0034375DDB